MKIVLKKFSSPALAADLLVIPAAAREGKKKKTRSEKNFLERFDSATLAAHRSLDSAVGKLLTEGLKRQDFSPAAGRRAEVSFDAGKHKIGTIRLSALSGLKKESAPDEWRKLGGDAFLSAKRLRARNTAIVLSHVKVSPPIIAAIVEGITLAAYQFTAFKGRDAQKKAKSEAQPTISLLVDSSPSAALQKALKQALLFAESVCFARDLVNTPPSDMLPVTLVKHARKIARPRSGVSLRVYDRRALTRMKAGALLGVSRGSSSDPYLMHLSYLPGGKARGRKRLTFVGKGITFDSGGLSIKTGKGMEDMKCDMAGAACVLGIFRALAALPKSDRPKHEIHGLIPTCENMVSADSLKPGDVIGAMNGKTIEVLNTDAEGRLILADALSYSERLKSDVIIDLATLTGACIVALGSDYAGMFASDQKLGDTLRTSFDGSGEKLWPLPLAQEYRAQMESDVADIRNIGTGGPGAILGALFLKEFVPAGVPWVHLDIAGPAFVTKGNEYIKRGGTGFGVLSLLRFAESYE